jgi:phage baseplate assembly protein W
MLPVYVEEATYDLVEEKLASKDFALDYKNNTVNGMREGLEEVKQAVFFILNTERYQYLIYPWSYGVELTDLIGQPMEYAIPEVERQITEALIQDDRIDSVDNFEFEQNKRRLKVTFTVHTNIGDFESVKVVDL